MNPVSNPRRARGLYVALALVGTFAAMLAALPAIAGGIEESGKVLVKMDEDWSKAAAAKDVEKLAAFYAEDAVAYPPNAPAAVGKAACKNVWAGMIADPNFIGISWKATAAEVSKSGELGFTAGTYEYSSKGADGKPVVEKGKYLCTWKKDKDGHWKAAHDMWNADTK